MRKIKFLAWNAGNNEWLSGDDIAIFYGGALSAFGNSPPRKWRRLLGRINIYSGARTSHYAHKTKEEADSLQANNRIDCIEITYRRPVEEKEPEVWE